MLTYNWHTHTSRCGHAVGTDEEYVQAAIEAGLTKLGFSDHAPYKDPFSGERMRIEELSEYISSVRHLKEKYRDQIDIYLGMEVECYKSEWDTLAMIRHETDYCILGQHNLDYDSHSSYGLTDGDELKEYTERLEYACSHYLCDYIAHPDVCLFSYPIIDESVITMAQKVADLSLYYHVPLELNCGSGVRIGKRRYNDGMRYAYPVRQVFTEFAKKGCEIVIGLDVHDPKLFATDLYIERALEVIEGLDCHIIYEYELAEAAKERKKLFF